MKKLIGKTKNNVDIYVIIENVHMLAHKDISEEMLSEAIQRVIYEAPFYLETIDLGRIIGKDACVLTNEKDDIRYECRPGREIKSRLVYGREPEDTALLTIGIYKDDDGLDTIFTAFPGQKAPKELEDPSLTDEERQEAEAFWACHALCV